LVESHAQSAYDYREDNRKVGLREHVVSTGLLNLCKAQRRGGDLPGMWQRRPGNRRAGQVLVIHRPSPIPAVLAVLAVPAASTGSPFWVADSVLEPLFFGSVPGLSGTAFVLLPGSQIASRECCSRLLRWGFGNCIFPAPSAPLSPSLRPPLSDSVPGSRI
jgi:hypothetical protein